MIIREDRFYTVKEASDLLKIHRSTFYRLVKKNSANLQKVGGKTLISGGELKKLVR